MGEVHSLPIRHRQTHGTIHVSPDGEGGFEIAHESESGSSWGNFRGGIRNAQEAIIRAHLLNVREYGGICHVQVAPAVMAAAYPSRERPEAGSRPKPAQPPSEDWDF